MTQEYIKIFTWFNINFQLKEHAAHALGFLLVGEENFPHHKKLIDGLCEASQVNFQCFLPRDW